MKKILVFLLIFCTIFISFLSQAGREDAILGTVLTILDFEEDHKDWLHSRPASQPETYRESVIERAEKY